MEIACHTVVKTIFFKKLLQQILVKLVLNNSLCLLARFLYIPLEITFS